MSEFFRCPFCRCWFLTQSDLALHLACFGGDAVAHRRNVKLAHVEVWQDFDEW